MTLSTTVFLQVRHRHAAPRRILCDHMGARDIVYDIFESENVRHLTTQHSED